MESFEQNLVSHTVPLRIRVGVTGHRTLSDDAGISRAIGNILSGQWRDALDEQSRSLLDDPSAPPVRFTAVSPLAEGADRLVAEAVLATPDGRLEVPLPMATEEYRKDFLSAASAEQFNTLLLKAVRIHHPVCGDCDIRGSGRADCYLNAGEEVIRRSDILIAVWDGTPANGRGGTAEIVALARKRRKPLFIISSGTGTLVENANAGALSFNGIISRISAFNSHNPPGAMTDRCSLEFRTLFETPEGKLIPDACRDMALRSILPH